MATCIIETSLYKFSCFHDESYARYEFSPFVFETYGFMAPHTKALLYRLADIASASVDILDIAYRDSQKVYKATPMGTNQNNRRSFHRSRSRRTPTTHG